MIKFWGISENTKIAILRPILVYISLTLLMTYFSNSFNFFGIIKTIGITAIAIILISFIVFIYQFLFSTPYQLYNEQQKIINIRENKDKLVKDLGKIINSRDPYNIHDHINIGADIYFQILDILKNSKCVSEADIRLFQDDWSLIKKYPEHGYAGKIRLFFLKDIMDSFSEIKTSFEEN